MEQVWFSAALWLILALIATLLSIWFRISTALSEIVVGTVAQLIIGAAIGTEVLGAKSGWVGFFGRNRRDRAHVLGWRRTRPRNLPIEVERGLGRRTRWFLWAISGCCRGRAFPAAVVCSGELACRSCLVHNVGGRRVRGDARARIEPDGFRQGHPGGLLCQ